MKPRNIDSMNVSPYTILLYFNIMIKLIIMINYHLIFTYFDSNNSIGSEGCKYLSESIAKLTQLTSLKLNIR